MIQYEIILHYTCILWEVIYWSNTSWCTTKQAEKVCFQKKMARVKSCPMNVISYDIIRMNVLETSRKGMFSKLEQDEDANMCLNAKFDYGINEVTNLSYCLFYGQLKNDFENLRNIESFLTNKSHYLQKEIGDLKQENERLQTLN